MENLFFLMLTETLNWVKRGYKKKIERMSGNDKRQETEVEVAELKMLRFSLGVTRMEKIRNEHVRGTAQVGHVSDKVREERLRWFGHVQRRDMGYRT